VNRLKAIKREQYGRASLDLLRKRVICHCVVQVTKFAPELSPAIRDRGAADVGTSCTSQTCRLKG
jgi:hypothetical protein